MPAGLTTTYYKTFAPRIGIWRGVRESRAKPAFAPGGACSTTRWSSWCLNNSALSLPSAEATSSATRSSILRICSRTGRSSQILSTESSIRLEARTLTGSASVHCLLYGQFQPHLRTQYSAQYNFNIQRELAKDLVLQVGYVGSQGHRLLASHDVNFGNPKHVLICTNFLLIPETQITTAASSMLIARSSCLAGLISRLICTFPMAARQWFRQERRSGRMDITLVGLRPYSSPACEPLTGAGCPTDGTPVFSSIFAEDTIANSNYNSFRFLWRSGFPTACNPICLHLEQIIRSGFEFRR